MNNAKHLYFLAPKPHQILAFRSKLIHYQSVFPSFAYLRLKWVLFRNPLDIKFHQNVLTLSNGPHYKPSKYHKISRKSSIIPPSIYKKPSNICLFFLFFISSQSIPWFYEKVSLSTDLATFFAESLHNEYISTHYIFSRLILKQSTKNKALRRRHGQNDIVKRWPKEKQPQQLTTKSRKKTTVRPKPVQLAMATSHRFRYIMNSGQRTTFNNKPRASPSDSRFRCYRALMSFVFSVVFFFSSSSIFIVFFPRIFLMNGKRRRFRCFASCFKEIQKWFVHSVPFFIIIVYNCCVVTRATLAAVVVFFSAVFYFLLVVSFIRRQVVIKYNEKWLKARGREWNMYGFDLVARRHKITVFFFKKIKWSCLMRS